jgi:hypothetical protein
MKLLVLNQAIKNHLPSFFQITNEFFTSIPTPKLQQELVSELIDLWVDTKDAKTAGIIVKVLKAVSTCIYYIGGPANGRLSLSLLLYQFCADSTSHHNRYLIQSNH